LIIPQIQAQYLNIIKHMIASLHSC